MLGGRAASRSLGATARRARRPGQRGSQSLEWVTLGALVATVMTAATHYAAGDSGLAAGVANAVFTPVRDMLSGTR